MNIHFGSMCLFNVNTMYCKGEEEDLVITQEGRKICAY